MINAKKLYSIVELLCNTILNCVRKQFCYFERKGRIGRNAHSYASIQFTYLYSKWLYLLMMEQTRRALSSWTNCIKLTICNKNWLPWNQCVQVFHIMNEYRLIGYCDIGTPVSKTGEHIMLLLSCCHALHWKCKKIFVFFSKFLIQWC